MQALLLQAKVSELKGGCLRAVGSEGGGCGAAGLVQQRRALQFLALMGWEMAGQGAEGRLHPAQTRTWQVAHVRRRTNCSPYCRLVPDQFCTRLGLMSWP